MSFTHSLMAGATTQGANLLISENLTIHSCSNGSNKCLAEGHKLTCGLEEPGIEPPIFQLEDD